VLQIAQFFVVNLVGLVIRYVILGLLEPPFGGAISGALPSLSSETVAKLATNGAVLVALAVVMLWNFFVNRYWTYNDVK
jgi:putative flippase GtrA